MKKQLLFLITLILLNLPAWGAEVIILQEDFASVTSGDNTTTGGSGTVFNGSPEFPTVNKASQAGGAIKLGSSSVKGSITSKVIDLSVNGGSFNVSFDIKGWTTIEGDITVTTGGTPVSITKKYTAKMADNFETINLEFTGGKANSQIKIETTAKRAFIDNIKVYYIDASTPTIIVKPVSLNTFSTTTIQPSTQTITVGGATLAENISLNITGADAQYFSVTPSSLTPINGTVADTDVTITYASTTAGTHTATLTLKSAGAADVTYDLLGTAVLPTLTTPLATQATTITANSFVANWDAVANATEYQLSVSSVAGSTAPADGTKENPYSVADRRNGSATGMNWITGYIVGVVISNSGTNLNIASGPTFSSNQNLNIVLADSPTETNGGKLIAVQLPSGAIRDALNLYANPQNLGKGVKIYGNFESYFSAPGVKSPTDYVLDVAIGAVVTPIAGSPFTITDAISYEVTGLDPNTDYVYSVIAKGVDYLDSEKSNEIQVTTNDITIVDVESITDITNSDVYYRVNAILEGVYQDGNYVYIKNEKGENPNATTQPANPKPNDDLDKFFEQSNWMKINVPNAQNYAESLIDAGMIGKLNATTGVFEVMSIADPVSIAGTGYKPFYTDNTTKYNSFRIKNFFKQPDGYYFIAPQEFEVAYICQVKYETIDNKSYFVSGNDKIEVVETVALPTDVLAADQGYNSKAIFLKQPKADDPTEKEWVIEHLGGGSITTGVSDITIGNDGVTVIGGNGTIEVLATNASTINVYNLSGATVRSIDNATNNATITVPAGIYIVKVQNSVAKVIVK